MESTQLFYRNSRSCGDPGEARRCHRGTGHDLLGDAVVDHYTNYTNYADVELAAFGAAVTDWALPGLREDVSGPTSPANHRVIDPATEQEVATVELTSVEQADAAIER